MKITVSSDVMKRAEDTVKRGITPEQNRHYIKRQIEKLDARTAKFRKYLRM